MKPFDLGAAKAGAKFFRYNDSQQWLCSYVGMRANGSVVFEIIPPEAAFDRSGSLSWAQQEALRMVTTKVVRYTTPWALFGLQCEVPLRSLKAVRDGGHTTLEKALSCGGCQHSGMTDAENPIIRLEWEE